MSPDRKDSCWVDLATADGAASTRSTAPCWPFFDSGEEFGHFNITIGELARHGPALSAIDANGPALPYPIDRRPGQRHQLNA
jgi:hypothetical protein